jgi:hypothetical protein
MRITNIVLYSNSVETVSFSLNGSDPSSKYIVRGITGLDAEEIIPKFYGLGLVSTPPLNTKPRFYDFSMKPRTVVIRVSLNPRFKIDETYAQVRDELYRSISSDRSGLVTMHFMYGPTTIARLIGYITKFEVSHFTQLPETQLTILCVDPMFRAINPVVLEDEDLADTNPVIVPDSISTAPHGFTMKVTFELAATTFTIQDKETSPVWKFKIIPSGGFQIGDQLFMSTEYANRYLYIMRSTTKIDLVDKIETGSVWPIIFPSGVNEFHFVNIGSIEWDYIKYFAAYWGV